MSKIVETKQRNIVKNRRLGKNSKKDIIEKFLIKQNYLCAICRVDLREKVGVLDHCHRTGINRGVLCRSCNTGIGLLKEDFKTLYQAALYLAKSIYS